MNVSEAIAAAHKGEAGDAVVRALASATEDDLPALLAALQSKKADFSVRELVADPVTRLGGVKFLRELMTALRKGFEEGHDNDGFQAHLADLAEREPEAVRAALTKMAETAKGEALEDIKWLLEYCK